MGLNPAAAREVTVTLPDWVADVVDYDRPYTTDTDRMRVAVTLAAENVDRGTGGPFGAAVFDSTGLLIAVGVNRVVPLNSSSLHAEIVSLMMAQTRLGTYTLHADGTKHGLFTSCEPCAMCLGATQWSGVSRVVWAATRDDAGRLDFDEGPVFDASYEYLRARGIVLEQGPLRAEAAAILSRYGESGGEIYNG
jgi:tRNA(Arg) A34 adenosine deaminase TadA